VEAADNQRIRWVLEESLKKFDNSSCSKWECGYFNRPSIGRLKAEARRNGGGELEKKFEKQLAGKKKASSFSAASETVTRIRCRVSDRGTRVSGSVKEKLVESC
jgi:hypothetical protein